jgi:ribosome-binding factor A
MAQSRRVERVAALIRREVSELLVNGIRDERVHRGMVSVTDVQVAGDLQHCRIFVSVLGSPGDREEVLAGLQAASAYVKGELSRRLRMRRTPDLVFRLDRGLERGTAVLGLLHQLEQERHERDDAPGDNNSLEDSSALEDSGY